MSARERVLSRAAAFWLLACLLASFLFAASAPSPLYSLYQAMWRFPPSTLTLIYAVYAFGALAALVITGRLSDHAGRRLATAIALLVQIIGMLAFIVAQSPEWLYAARVLQGVGTGMAAGAISAWLLDLQPHDNPRLGSVVAGTALLAGLALGGLGSSLLVEYGPDPLHLVYWLLTAAYALALAGLRFIPDPVPRVPGWLRSLRPEIGVPRPARSPFALSAPSMVALWAVGGLYLSLGPSLAGALVHTDNRVAGGLVIAALLGGGAVASFVVRDAEPRAMLVWGSAILIGGIGVTLLAVAFGSTLGLYAGSVIAGFGFGPAFSGALRTVAPLAPPDARGALLAAIYVVVYLAFSVPTILAGFAVQTFGLRGTTFGYGLIVMALAAVTTVAVAGRTRSGTQRRNVAS
jgi:MFS family permease